MDCRGLTALVTGGAHRLGGSITLELAAAGANVVVNYHRSEQAARATVEEAQRLGVKALAVRADVSDARQVERLCARALEAFERIDVLVANAGAFRRTPLGALSEEEWDSMFRLNFRTALLPARLAGAHMRARGRGCIVAVADVAAFRPWADHAPYCIAKSCIVGLVKSLAAELAPSVRVNAVAPGPVLFPPGFDPEARRRELARTLLQRAGTAGDVARAVVHLVANDYVTGVVLPVDGGRLLAGAAQPPSR